MTRTLLHSIAAGALLTIHASAGGFTDTQRIADPKPTLEEQFGKALAVSRDGTYILVAAPARNSPGLNAAGAALVFKRSGSTWSVEAMLTPDDAVASDQFANAVALSDDGSVALIGAASKKVGSQTAQGQCYIFKRSGTTWTQAQKFTGDTLAFSQFGASVALSGDGLVAAIGAPRSGQLGGKGYIFHSDGTTFTQAASFTGDHPYDAGGGLDQFGAAAAISGDGKTAVFGASASKYEGGMNWKFGEAYVYTSSGGTWSRQAALSSGDQNDFLGAAASLSNDGRTLLLGAPGRKNDSTVRTGAGVLYTSDGAAWTRALIMVPSDGLVEWDLGKSVALSGSGALALVGSARVTVGDSNFVGGVYAYTISAGSATETKINLSDRQALDNYGTAVAISRDGLIAVASAITRKISDLRQGIAEIWVAAPPSVMVNSTPDRLLFNASGAGCDPGTGYTTAKSLTWTPGSSCTLAMATPQNGPAGTRYVFSQWENASAGAARLVIAPSVDTTYTATFDTQHQLTAAANPPAGGTVTGAGWYASGAAASVTAVPATGYKFTGWSGDCSGAGACSPDMTEPRRVTANFVQRVNLGVTVTAANGGAVTGTVGGAPFSCSTTCSATANAGDGITLTAAAATGYTFTSWSGCDSTAGATCTVTMNAARNVGAVFTVNSGTLTFTQTLLTLNRATGRYQRTLTVTNPGAAITAAAFVADNLAAGVTLYNASGVTSATSPAGSPYLELGAFGSNASRSFTIEFTRTGSQSITYTTRILGEGAR